MKSAVTDSQEDIHIGAVEYFDYTTHDVPWMNAVRLCHCKRKSFEHERELRISVFDSTTKVDGRSLGVDLEKLVESVVVAPGLPAWQVDLMGRLMRRYGLNRDVGSSSLDDRPLY